MSLSLFDGGEEEGGTPREFAAEEPAAGQALETAETGALVQKALLGLDEESRAVVVLRELEGQSYGEISEALGLPEGTVKSRLFRARETLKETLKRKAA